MIENQKKRRENGIKFFLHKSPYKTSFTNGIHNLLKRADAREIDDIIYLICDAYRYLQGRLSY